MCVLMGSLASYLSCLQLMTRTTIVSTSFRPATQYLLMTSGLAICDLECMVVRLARWLMNNDLFHQSTGVRQIGWIRKLYC